MSDRTLAIRTAYRLLTGPDDAAFCRRVTEALAKGWSLYGAPTLAYDLAQNRIVCGQAVVKELKEDVAFSDDVKLSEL